MSRFCSLRVIILSPIDKCIRMAEVSQARRCIRYCGCSVPADQTYRYGIIAGDCINTAEVGGDEERGAVACYRPC